jgi:predicted acetyltransferase
METLKTTWKVQVGDVSFDALSRWSFFLMSNTTASDRRELRDDVVTTTFIVDRHQQRGPLQQAMSRDMLQGRR